MRRSAAPGILALCTVLSLACAGPARAARILEETGREMLAPDGRTLIDREDGFSIVLPASDWKVRLERPEPMPDNPDLQDEGRFQLIVASPDGEVRLRVYEKVHPFPMSFEEMKRLLPQEKNPQVRNARAEIIETTGTKCLEHESETKGSKGWYHRLGRICDGRSERKLVVMTELFSYPVERWSAEEKVTRELVGSFRVLP